MILLPVPWDEEGVEGLLDTVAEEGGVALLPFGDAFKDALRRYAVEPTSDNRARAKKAGLAWVEAWNERAHPLGFESR